MSDGLSVIQRYVQTTLGKGYFLPWGLFCGFIKPDEFLKNYKNPIFCFTTDNVGTKIIEADLMGNWEVIGQDIVNHNAIDLAVHGAKALVFLDYIAGFDRFTKETLEALFNGMASAARKISCPIIGGETACMPNIYQKGRYDVAGFMFGVVEEDKVISGENIREEDVIIGVASSGLHTNSYTLTRTVLFSEKDQVEIKKLLKTYYHELGCTLGEALIRPHFPYYSYIHQMLDLGFGIHGMAHITGGGLAGNIIRILPDYTEAVINENSWPRPPIFSLIQKTGSLPEDQMREAFNLGIGLACIVPSREMEKVLKFFQSNNISAYEIGIIQRAKKKSVRFN